MVIQCEFNHEESIPGEEAYKCIIKNCQPPENRDIELAGNHEFKRNSKDVNYVFFINCKITKVPQRLTKIFQNLTSLCLVNSKLKKITKNDLIEYKNLQKIICRENEIEFLPGDLFEGFKNLQHITFYGNLLQVIEPNILDGLTGLKHVNFKNNPNYNICYSIYPEYEPNATLDEVKKIIYEKFMSRYKVIRDLRASEATLMYENYKLTAIVEANRDKMEIMFKKLEATACRLENTNASLASLTKENQKLKSKLEMKERQNLSEASFAADIKDFIADETTKDFKIIIDGHEFPVHKFLLAARSPTLAEIFKNNPDVENLNLVDISVDIFEIILMFFYTDELPGDEGTNFWDLFTSAAKLKITKLVEYAATKITDKVIKENALTVFKISASFGLKDLKRKSFYLVKNEYKRINILDYWIHDPNTMINIIEKFKKKEETARDYEIEFNKLSL